MSNTVKIHIDGYDYICADNYCYIYSTVVTVNGVELENHNQDVYSMLSKVSIHLWHEIEITETINGDE